MNIDIEMQLNSLDYVTSHMHSSWPLLSQEIFPMI